MSTIEEAIQRVKREYNSTIVTTTHNMFQAESITERVALLLRGKIVEIGTSSEIFGKASKNLASFTRLENLDQLSPESVWDTNAKTWAGTWPEGGDFNHRFIIIPELLRMLDLQKSQNILDVACGEGTVSRELGRRN